MLPKSLPHFSSRRINPLHYGHIQCWKSQDGSCWANCKRERTWIKTTGITKGCCCASICEARGRFWRLSLELMLWQVYKDCSCHYGWGGKSVTYASQLRLRGWKAVADVGSRVFLEQPQFPEDFPNLLYLYQLPGWLSLMLRFGWYKWASRPKTLCLSFFFFLAFTLDSFLIHKFLPNIIRQVFIDFCFFLENWNWIGINTFPVVYDGVCKSACAKWRAGTQSKG